MKHRLWDIVTVNNTKLGQVERYKTRSYKFRLVEDISIVGNNRTQVADQIDPNQIYKFNPVIV